MSIVKKRCAVYPHLPLATQERCRINCTHWKIHKSIENCNANKCFASTDEPDCNTYEFTIHTYNIDTSKGCEIVVPKHVKHVNHSVLQLPEK